MAETINFPFIMWSPKFDEAQEVTRAHTQKYVVNDLKASIEGSDSKNVVVINAGWLTSVVLENNLYQCEALSSKLIGKNVRSFTAMQDGFNAEDLVEMSKLSYSNWATPTEIDIQADDDLTATGMLASLKTSLSAANSKVGITIVNVHNLVDRDFKQFKNLDTLIKQIEAAATAVSPQTLMVLTGFQDAQTQRRMLNLQQTASSQLGSPVLKDHKDAKIFTPGVSIYLYPNLLIAILTMLSLTCFISSAYCLTMSV